MAIAGGGIIGLATALELAAAGRQVTVFEQSAAMSEASGAAAGMLAGPDPENPSELRELACLSLSLYPGFLARVEELSGLLVPMRTRCTVQGFASPLPGATTLSPDEMNELAPGCSTGGWHFYRFEEQSFDPGDLAAALPKAACAAGVDLLEHTPVLSVTDRNMGVELSTAAGSFSADAFLNATGAWASVLDDALPIVPRKGHMLTVELAVDRQLRCVLRTGDIYIVPRGENRYTIGSTLESAGFDKHVDPARIQGLLHKAAELWPTLRQAHILRTWTGLRPGSEDGLPILDVAGQNCWVATGHFRNGILLAPATGSLISQWINRSRPELDLARFRISRFAGVAS